MKKIFIALFIITCFSNAQCLKEKLDHNGLPPNIQEGKNKLGFLLNGQPWIPKGFIGRPRLSIKMDPNWRNGYLRIQANRIVNGEADDFEIEIKDSLTSVSSPHTFIINATSRANIYYTSNDRKCFYRSDDGITKAEGRLIITKFDRAKRIIAGIFHAKLTKDSCKDIMITLGRFDMKY